MKLRYFFFSFLIFSVLSFNHAIAQTGAARGKGRVKGTVKDAQGNPLEGVTIRFTSDEKATSFEIKTDKEGKWAVAGIAGGAWNIDFVKEGYEEKKISAQLSSLSYNKPIDIVLEKGAPAPIPKEKVPGLDLVEQGNQLKNAKDYAGAIAKYEAALQVNPALNALYGDMANIYVEMGQTDKAIDAFNKFLQKEPTNQNAKIGLGSIYLQKGQVEEAKKVLGDLNLDVITEPNTLYNLGVGFYNAKLNEEAIKYWEKAVALDPKFAEAHFQLAVAYYGVNQKEKAKQEFQKVIELDPQSDNAKMAKEMIDTMQ